MVDADLGICGGGLAGLCLALQARRELPGMRVTVLEATRSPLPEAAHKVGEATTEISAYYFGQRLGLKKHLAEGHIRKVGLRFFFTGDGGEFADRPELGLSRLAPAPSYLVDRGRLENELREQCVAAGVQLVEGARVREIELGEGEAPHRVLYWRDGGEATLSCDWVVDSLGRRRLLQRQLGLDRRPRGRHAAAWFRVRGAVDVETFVPPERHAWHDRMHDRRYHSTTHLTGPGRWVWLIPLGSGCTSVGVVMTDALHDPSDFRTLDATLAWIAQHEPELSAALEGLEVLDYRRLVGYSHTTRKLHSRARWSCLGDAAQFADPFYSPGMDLISLGNCATVEILRKHRLGQLDDAEVTEQNHFLAAINDWVTQSIQGGYPYMGNAHVMAAKVVWDTSAAWSLLGPQMFGGLAGDPAARREARRATSRFFSLTLTVQRLFAEWAALPARRPAFEFADYLTIPSMKRIHVRNLRDDRTLEEIVAGAAEDMRYFEELAQVFFRMALEDTRPELLAQLPDPLWVNAWGVTLDPERWERSKLFEPDSEPRDLEPLRREVEAVLRPGS